VGNVANVVTECHRAPSWSIGTLQGVDGEVGDGNAKGDAERYIVAWDNQGGTGG